MPRAIKVTDETIPYIDAHAAENGFRLDTRDEVEFNASFGAETYLITDGQKETNNVVYTFMWGADFENTWKFENTESDKFETIVRK